MVDPDSTVLTDRQVEVLEHREAGLTQREIAERLGTTASNVSAIERAGRENVEKARRTLELMRTIRSPSRFSIAAGTTFDDVVEEIYDRGDETGIKLAYSRPELYAHLYEHLSEHTSENRLDAPVTIGLTDDGDVNVFPNEE